MRRTCIVELVVDKDTEKRLKQLCDLSSKLWNEVNYARLKMFLEKKGIDFEGTYKEFYDRYKPLIGSAIAQQILNKNNAWRGFFRLLELKREGRLPPFMTKVSSPGCRKKNKSRALWTVLRKDQYKMDGDRIILQGLGAIGWIEVRCKGPIYLKGEWGELRIRYDADRKKWYAHISFVVSEKAVMGEWRIVPQQPKGNLTASIDVGINNLMAIYVENGLTMLVNGRPLKSISHYWRMRLAKYESTLNGYGLKTSKRLRRMYMRWRRQIRHYIDAKVRQAVEWLYDIGVSKIKVGYPKDIIHDNGSFNNVHVWTYGYLLRRIAEVAEEYGIDVVYVDEAYTSSRCPLHGDGCGVRISRGLFKCTRLGKVFNADLAAAYNILMTSITSSPGRGNGPETRPRAKPSKRGDVAQTSPPYMGRRSFLLSAGSPRGDVADLPPRWGVPRHRLRSSELLPRSAEWVVCSGHRDPADPWVCCNPMLRHHPVVLLPGLQEGLILHSPTRNYPYHREALGAQLHNLLRWQRDYHPIAELGCHGRVCSGCSNELAAISGLILHHRDLCSLRDPG
jgi:putative transposase